MSLGVARLIQPQLYLNLSLRSRGIPVMFMYHPTNIFNGRFEYAGTTTAALLGPGGRGDGSLNHVDAPSHHYFLLPVERISKLL